MGDELAVITIGVRTAAGSVWRTWAVPADQAEALAAELGPATEERMVTDQEMVLSGMVVAGFETPPLTREERGA